MKYDSFLTQQNASYEAFRVATASLQELNVSPAINRPSAGYIAAIRYDTATLQTFGDFASSLTEVVPTMRYSAENGHTTITVFGKQPLDSFEPDPAKLAALGSAVEQVDQQLWREVRVDFQNWYFNAESIIVAGWPNEAFWEVGLQLQAAGRKQGLELRMPWGAHMTAGRFTAACGSEQVEALRRRLQSAPVLGVSAPVEIGVGTFTTDESGFKLHFVSSTD